MIQAFGCLLCGLGTVSCSDQWLEAKPDKALTVPNKVEDYQLLLDNRQIFGVKMPGLGELANDDYYLTYENWQSLSVPIERNTYLWADDIYEGNTNSDWINAYAQILQANIVLDGLDKLTVAAYQDQDKNNVAGQALFHRANCFFTLAQVFCKPFDPTTASTDLGLPLRVNADINEPISRATLADTYDQIFKDLILAADLLNDSQDYLTRPSKYAAYALLSRVYLAVGRYQDAENYADKVLERYPQLMDYRHLDTNAPYPIPLFNEEVIWHSEIGSYMNNPNLSGLVDSSLMDKYGNDDLRRSVFFFENKGGFQFKGNYRGTRFNLFGGLATDEIYLIAAECKIRHGDIDGGLKSLYRLLEKRYDGELYKREILDADEALAMVLEERRKELVFRGLRWIDLRRLNKEERFRKTLYRQLDGKVYTLEPESPKYVFPIPPDEIMRSGIQQNPR